MILTFHQILNTQKGHQLSPRQNPCAESSIPHDKLSARSHNNDVTPSTSPRVKLSAPTNPYDERSPNPRPGIRQILEYYAEIDHSTVCSPVLDHQAKLSLRGDPQTKLSSQSSQHIELSPRTIPCTGSYPRTDTQMSPQILEYYAEIDHCTACSPVINHQAELSPRGDPQTKLSSQSSQHIELSLRTNPCTGSYPRTDTQISPQAKFSPRRSPNATLSPQSTSPRTRSPHAKFSPYRSPNAELSPKATSPRINPQAGYTPRTSPHADFSPHTYSHDDALSPSRNSCDYGSRWTSPHDDMSQRSPDEGLSPRTIDYADVSPQITVQNELSSKISPNAERPSIVSHRDAITERISPHSPESGHDILCISVLGPTTACEANEQLTTNLTSGQNMLIHDNAKSPRSQTERERIICVELSPRIAILERVPSDELDIGTSQQSADPIGNLLVLSNSNTQCELLDSELKMGAVHDIIITPDATSSVKTTLGSHSSALNNDRSKARSDHITNSMLPSPIMNKHRKTACLPVLVQVQILNILL